MTITLLQELLRDRSDCFVLLRGQSVFCSCGHVSSDVKNIENHIVTHERVDFINEEEQIKEVVIGHLAELKKSLECHGLNEERLEVPPKTHFVTLAEKDIGGGFLTDASCPRCPGLVLKDFADLKCHFSRLHGDLWAAEGTIRTKSDFVDRKRREKSWAYYFFCPIPGCKYHIREPARKWFTELKLLRQHYVKVHAAKIFPCPSEGCSLTFPNAAALARHLTAECGREFACETCGDKYRSHENLLTHGRRRGHVVDRKRSEEKARREADKRRFAAVTRGGDVARIAPRPSHLHLSAAIALSELSAKRYLVDVGIQTESSRYSSTTQTTVSPRKRTTETETQTLKKRKRAKKQSASVTVSSATVTSAVMVDADVDVDFDLGVIAKDRPLWTASSTQTSPKWEPDPSTSEFPSGGISSSSAAAFIRAPRLGDIEQFNSTETQTENNAVAANNHTAADDWDSITAEFGLRQFMEAETQFDIDDILCSNYTQTRSSPILLEPMEEPSNSAGSFLLASTTSTQTLFKEQEESQETSESSKHMETQTG